MGNDPVRIGEQLRSDAVGTWHRAEHAGQPRTLRILREDLVGREDARLLFEEEVRRIRRLDHPALLGVHHVGASGERPFLLTDPIDGQTLADAAPLPEQAVVALGSALLDAYAYLEARKQIHAAPVPDRLVRVGADWRLLTFRDIRAWDELKSRKGKTWPDPAFAPPEQDRGHAEPLRPLPFLAWALGSLMRFAAGGGAPRTPDGQPAPLAADFPTVLGGVVARLLAWEPSSRPQGIPALKRALAGEGAAAPAPGTKRIQAPVARKKHGRGRR